MFGVTGHETALENRDMKLIVKEELLADGTKRWTLYERDWSKIWSQDPVIAVTYMVSLPFWILSRKRRLNNIYYYSTRTTDEVLFSEAYNKKVAHIKKERLDKGNCREEVTQTKYASEKI